MTREELLESLLAGDHSRGRALSRDVLRHTLEFAGRYAKLEKLLFGGTRVSYSSAALGMGLSIPGDVVRQGELLADAERVRFGLASGPILELGWLVEDQGIKIIPQSFPDGTAARGGFFFDSELGPCILVDSGATAVQRDYVIAHQYGHFLADFDPYITTLSGHPGPETLADPREFLWTRGKRGLEVLHHIQKQVNVDVRIVDRDFPAVKELDAKLIELAKEVHGKIITNDSNLNKVAELQGISVLNINELANAIKPVVLPGEDMNVKILKEGKEKGQGVAYLDDGTMIVVDNGRRYMGKTIDVIVTSVLQTPAGRMIFARLKEDTGRESRGREYYPLDSEF